jgi:hypothetical protein
LGLWTGVYALNGGVTIAFDGLLYPQKHPAADTAWMVGILVLVIIVEWIETARALGRAIPVPHGRLVYA